jgi:hypothetical protein
MLPPRVHKPTFPGGPETFCRSRQKALCRRKDCEAVLVCSDTERMSGVARHVDVHTSDHFSPPGGDAVQGDVVPERIGANGVVVVRRPEPNDQAGRLVVLAGIGQEARRHVDIASGEGPVKSERQAVFIWPRSGLRNPRPASLSMTDHLPGPPSPEEAKSKSASRSAVSNMTASAELRDAVGPHANKSAQIGNRQGE